MPDPKSLKVGDRVRFVSLPEEWAQPHCTVHENSVEFMKQLLTRTWPSRVCEIDEWGNPWVDVRLKVGDKYEHHSWAILESTGWRFVEHRT